MTTYGTKARVLPVTLAALPIAADAALIIPITLDWRSLLSVPAVGILVFVLDQLGRDKGKNLQPHLWQSWGGAPTTIILRHRNPSNNPILLEKRLSSLRSKTGVSLPTKEQELANPEDADSKYEASISILRALTYDKSKYPLVFLENCNYGFRRNCLGLRKLAVVVCSVSTLAATATTVLAASTDLPIKVWGPSACIAVSVALLGFWTLVVSGDWVKIAAFSYAERLVDTAGIP